MSKKANPTVIGLFVMVGIALAVTGVIIFASGNFFTQKATFIAYFPGSVNGLDIGSPVKFKGVEIGTVSDIMIPDGGEISEEIRIPVLIKIDEERVTSKTGERNFVLAPENVSRAIENGLRAKLETQSILTGLLYVDLDIYPNADAPEYFRTDDDFQEIPTTSSVLARLVTSLAEVDLKEVALKVQSILGNLDAGLGEIEFREINQRLVTALESLNNLINSPEISEGLLNIRAITESANALLVKVDEKVDPLADNVQKALNELTTTLQELNLVAEDVDSLIEPDAPLMFEVSQVLRELSEAARSVRVLTDYLSRNPNAILTGRDVSTE